jgi:hypothetical protein
MRLLSLCIVAVFLLTVSCANTGSKWLAGNATQSNHPLGALPVDELQPGEQLDAAGHVNPTTARRSSQLPTDAPFAAGAESFSTSSDVTILDGAAGLTAPAGGMSYAVYRFVLGGAQPATLAVDANVHLNGTAPGTYWVGVSDYASHAWQWHGPFSDSQVTVPLSSGNYTSPLGNTFVAIAAYDATQLDVVGVLVAPHTGDTTAPPAVTAAPQLTPVTGGFEVQWLPVVAGDLAGYRVYYSFSPFATASANGVNSLPWLENTTRLFLPVIGNRLVWVGIAAVDSDGNESALSSTASAKPLVSNAPALEVRLSAATAEFGKRVTLTYSGADSFDLDLDGNGDFEITDVPAGNQTVPANAIGILRPRVRGSSEGGKSVAFGSVSLLVPAPATLQIDPPSPVLGQNTYLHLSLPGAATDVQWDLNGDGTFETNSAAAVDYTTQYQQAGRYNIAVKATYLGMALTASRPLVVQGWRKTQITSAVGYEGYGAVVTMINGKPAIAFQSYDPGFANPHLNYVRASDPEGTAWGAPVQISAGGTKFDLKEINGRPCLAYFDDTFHLRFAQASNASGTAWEPAVDIDTTTDNYAQVSLIQLAGVPPVPAVAYSQAPSYDLVFRRALDGNGATWSAATYPDSAGVSSGIFCRLDMVSGNPAIGYCSNDGGSPYYQAWYIRAADPNGVSWGVPKQLIFSGSNYGALNLGFAVIQDIPKMFITVQDPVVVHLYNFNSVDNLGTNWAFGTLETDNHATSALNLFAAGGMPVLAYSDDNAAQGMWTRALDTDGTIWPVPQKLPTGPFTTAAEVAGAPALSAMIFSPTAADSDLYFYRLY